MNACTIIDVNFFGAFVILKTLMKKDEIKQFQKTIWDFYKKNRRDLPWRNTHNPYHIFISEVMLQQTQVQRVIPKYEAFVQAFPTFKFLANAPFVEVLRVWKGLGYNRRALYLQKAAQSIVTNYNSILPNDEKLLLRLPGIGKNTAGSLRAFIFNEPVIFIETNIRTVFIHTFFKDKVDISDQHILPLIASTLATTNPREWYYGLMDYGSFLKKQDRNASAHKSKHYTTPSTFEGSNRQLRGKILEYLLLNKKVLDTRLEKDFAHEITRLQTILDDLLREGLIQKNKNYYEIQSFRVS